jgi:hypothetical protein
VKELIQRSIRSIDQLDTIILLRTPPLRSWSDAEVGRALHIPADFARLALEELVSNGLCRCAEEESGSQTFQAAALGDESGMRELCQVNHEHRLAIVFFISRQTIARTRLAAPQTVFEAVRTLAKKS